MRKLLLALLLLFGTQARAEKIYNYLGVSVGFLGDNVGGLGGEVRLNKDKDLRVNLGFKFAHAILPYVNFGLMTNLHFVRDESNTVYALVGPLFRIAPNDRGDLPVLPYFDFVPGYNVVHAPSILSSTEHGWFIQAGPGVIIPFATHFGLDFGVAYQFSDNDADSGKIHRILYQFGFTGYW